ncbi:MAG TPA: hypothetical protein VG917_01770 [Patescibacteria group bacterium]|nr:hypothetical protein [Patescibacteria group bacterium]
MDSENTNENPLPYTVDELQEEKNKLEDLIDGIPYEERSIKEQQLIQGFIDKQIKEKDRFQNVFKTDQGSVYFTLSTGESLRIKQREGKWEMQPICRKIFYTDNDTADEFEEDVRKGHSEYEPIIGKPISTTELKIGATPIEFEILGGTPPIAFEESPGKIVIKGDHMGFFASGYHRGHPITEVIK